MASFKNKVLEDKEKNVFSLIEREAVQTLFSILMSEDVLFNNIPVREMGDDTAFFDRHEKRINAMLDFFRGLMVVGFEDDKMKSKLLDIFNKFIKDETQLDKLSVLAMMNGLDDFDNQSEVAKAIIDAPSGPFANKIKEGIKNSKAYASMKTEEVTESWRDEDDPKGNRCITITTSVIFSGLDYALMRLFDGLDFETFKALDVMSLNKRIREGIDELAEKNDGFKHDWEVTQQRIHFNNLYTDKMNKLIVKLCSIGDEATFNKVKDIVYDREDFIVPFIIESDENFVMDTSDEAYDKKLGFVETMFFSFVANVLRTTEHFEEIYPYITDFLVDIDDEFKKTDLYKEIGSYIDWLTEQTGYFYSDNVAFIRLRHFDSSDSRGFITTNASKKVTNFFKGLTEEEKQMVRRGELLGEYRIENFERGQYVK